MSSFWKDNWDETKQRFVDWWDHKRVLIGHWAAGIDADRTIHEAPDPGPAASLEERYTNAVWRAGQNHYELSRRVFPLDILPVAETDLGPGSLCLYLGCDPGFSERTVWYHPCITDSNRDVPLAFDPQQRWWQVQEAIISRCVQKSDGKYCVGIPDLAEGVDILASLRGTEALLMDMLDDPEWVRQKLGEIDAAYVEVYQRVFDSVHSNEDGCAFRAFCLWSPGRVAKVQCDSAAMLSPAMFREFCVPHLESQCAWLDHSMFHLDGTQCIVHLEALLEIESLDAIEWTPQAGLPGGADEQWHAMYHKILNAGKSLQIVGVRPHEIMPLLNAVGTEGIYILTDFSNEAECERVSRQIDTLR